MRTELDGVKRRALVSSFLQTLFPPNGIGMGTGEMDRLGKPFEKKLNSVGTQTAISEFIKAVKGTPTGANVAAMKRELDGAFE